MDNPIISLLKNKFITYTAIFFIVVLLLLIAINTIRGRQSIPSIQSPLENNHTSPTPLAIPTVPLQQTFIISGVTVKNFYKNPTDSNSTNDVSFFENADFSMTYVAAFQQFYIAINNSDFLPTREKAEQKFLELLGINQTDACKLNVQESVPLQSQSAYAGGVYPLSFCKTSD